MVDGIPSLGGPFSLGARGVRGFEVASVSFVADGIAASSLVASVADSPLTTFFALGFLVFFFFSAPVVSGVPSVVPLVDSV